MKPNWRRAKPRSRPRARSRVENHRSHWFQGCSRTIRSISPTKNPASCRCPAAASSSATPQAAVAAGSMLVVVADVVQAPNDKQQLAPMVEKIAALPKELGEAETLLADTGYFSADNVSACNQAGIDPLDCRGPSTALSVVATAFRTGAAGAQRSNAGPNHGASLQTPEGRALYALRKQTQEPVFSIIKSILGFRQFSLRGLEKVRGKLEPRNHGLEYQASVRPRSTPA